MADIKKSAKAGQMVSGDARIFDIRVNDRRLILIMLAVCGEDPSQRSRSNKTLHPKVYSNESAAASRISAYAGAQE